MEKNYIYTKVVVYDDCLITPVRSHLTAFGVFEVR